MLTDVIKAVKGTIEDKDMINKNGHVVLGLSGGPDSMCLFHVLLSIKDEIGFTLSAVHLNHLFRPGHAEEDQAFVENLCIQHGVYCYSKTMDVNELAAKQGLTSEEAGRNERYTAFDEEATRIEKSGIRKQNIAIAVAQNKNDQVETLLMRILRGTGTDGLAGIPYKRISEAGFQIIRPLLDVDRNDIEAYCSTNNLNPRMDHTNEETGYNRNKIRLDLIPKLKSEYNRNIEDAVLRLSASASMDKEYFSKRVNDVMKKHCHYNNDKTGRTVSVSISSEILNELHSSVRRRVIVEALKTTGLVQGIEAVHIEAADKTINKNQTGSVIEFPESYRMKICYGAVKFYNESDINMTKDKTILPFRIEIDKPGKPEEILLASGKLTISLTEHLPDKLTNSIACFDYNQLVSQDEGIFIRYRNKGDRIELKGMKGSKKLQDLFVDEKVPRETRDSIPILVSGPHVLWVAGIRRSYKYQCGNGTKACLLLEWKPNN